MEQAGRSSGESDQNQQQRRMKMPENISSATQPPQPPPQKCLRCDSNNTKFCYYNNYSLTQPRYFCKTCRRYWTQGGTLRNVPVGGGCRKGKRTMKGGGSGGSGGSYSSTGEISSRSNHQQPQQITTLSAAAAFFSGNSSRTQPPPLPSMSSLYPGGGGGGGGFLSSLAAMQSMSQLSQGVNNQSQLGVNNQFGNFHIPSSTPPKVQSQQMEQPSQGGFYQMVNREKSMESSFYPSDQTLQFQPTRPLGSWTQRFINNNIMWPNSSASSSSSAGAINSATAAGASLSLNQWPDLPGFGPSP